MMGLSIISVEKVVLETDCLQVSLPTASGVITILPHHTPLYSLLSSGDVIVKNINGDKEILIINGGFVTVASNKVTILTDFGIRLGDIDEAIIMQAKENAEKAMAEKVSDEHFSTSQAELFKAMLQLKAVQRHKSKR